MVSVCVYYLYIRQEDLIVIILIFCSDFIFQYYTRKYISPTDLPFDQRINNSSIKRFSVPACEQLTKSKTSVPLVYSSGEFPTTPTNQQYVSQSTTVGQPHLSVSVKPIIRKSFSTIGIIRVRIRFVSQFFSRTKTGAILRKVDTQQSIHMSRAITSQSVVTTYIRTLVYLTKHNFS